MSLTLNPIRVAQPGQLLEIMACGTDQDQYLRELVMNGLQAGAKNILIDWCPVDGVDKFRICDDGVGMSADELVTRFASLAAADRTGFNFGVGAKIACAAANRIGTQVVSMQDGVAYTLTLSHDAVGGWSYSDPQPLNDVEVAALLPDWVITAGHGTAVILHGNTVDEPTADTFARAFGKDISTPGRNGHWVAGGVNARFLRFNTDVSVGYVVRAGREKGDYRSISGRRHYLDLYSAQGDGAQGDLVVTAGNGMQARITWFAVDTAAKKSSFRRFSPLGNTVGIVVDDELYTTALTPWNAGVWKGADKVELHLHPIGLKVQPKIDRTDVVVDGEPLPVKEWLAAFRKNMPEPLAERLRAAGADSEDSPTAAVLAKFQRWFPMTVSSHIAGGNLTGTLLDARSLAGLVKANRARRKAARPTDGANRRRRRIGEHVAGTPRARRAQRRNGHPDGPKDPKVSGRLGAGSDALSETTTGVVPPQVKWCDDPEQVPGLTGWAAVYHPGQHLLVCNQTDTTLRMVIDAVNASLGDAVGLERRVRRAAEEATAARLVGVILGTQITGHTLELTPQVLTGAVLDLVDNIDKIELRVRRLAGAAS